MQSSLPPINEADEQFVCRCLDYLDDALAVPDREAFEAALVADRAVRQKLVLIAIQCQMLEEACRPDALAHREQALSMLLDRDIMRSLVDAVQGPGEAEGLGGLGLAGTGGVAGGSGLVPGGLSRRALADVALVLLYRRWAWGLAVAACLAVAALVGVSLYEWGSPEPVQVSNGPWGGAGASRPEPALGAIVQMQGAWWSDGRTARVGQVLSGDGLQLSGGVIQVVTESGVRVTIEGPARLDIADASRLVVSEGRVFVSGTSREAGLTVESPQGVVVSRGGSFGVVVDEAGWTDLQVVRGGVSLLPRGDIRAERVLEAGRAVRVQEGRVESVRLPASAVLREVPTGYEMKVRSAKPLLWWSFGAGSGDAQALTDRGSGGADAQRVSGVTLHRDTARDWARFDGAGDVVSAGSTAGMSLPEAMTIEVWMRGQAGEETGRFLSSMDEPPGGLGIGLLGAGFAREAQCLDAAGEVFAAEPNSVTLSLYGVYDLCTQPGVVPGQWNHIVAVIHPARPAEIYLNGKRVRVGVRRSPVQDPGDQRFDRWRNAVGPLASAEPFALARNPASITGPEAYAGDLDELVLYGRALPPEDIAELYRLGAVQTASPEEHDPLP